MYENPVNSYYLGTALYAQLFQMPTATLPTTHAYVPVSTGSDVQGSEQQLLRLWNNVWTGFGTVH